MDDNLQNAPNQVMKNHVNELYDIEVLVVPGIDWAFWFASVGWVLAGLLVLIVVLYFGSRWYRPLVLKWQLKMLSKHLSATEQNVDQTVSKAQVWKLYAWLKKLNHELMLSPKGQTASFYTGLRTLMEQVNRASFSDEVVSRETYLDLIQQAELLIKQCSVLPNLKAAKGNNQTEEERWRQ